MNEKKILIFEDDWKSIKGSFDLANIFAFEGKLSFVQVCKSQDVSMLDWRLKYSIVFVDITLAKNTALDGYNIISTIKERNLFDLSKIVVMTANSKVAENLKSYGIDLDSLHILYKPVAFDDLAKLMKELLLYSDR